MWNLRQTCLEQLYAVITDTLNIKVCKLRMMQEQFHNRVRNVHSIILSAHVSVTVLGFCNCVSLLLLIYTGGKKHHHNVSIEKTTAFIS